MNNTYEAAEVIEIGQAHELILGVKEIQTEDNATGDPLFLAISFAEFDE